MNCVNEIQYFGHNDVLFDMKKGDITIIARYTIMFMVHLLKYYDLNSPDVICF